MNQPPEPLNLAGHLFDANVARAAKTAYVDDRGGLSYGELAERSRRFAAALLGLGVRRDERVLLLLLDTNEWPVAFLGSLYAGVIPVAVNTMLTADDYAYMLEHSRAQAAIVSGSAKRPGPTIPQARTPSSGSTITWPRARSTRTFSCVAGWFHIFVFIAGARTTGPVKARYVVVRKSSANPCASFARMLAVAGAITRASAACASAMCSICP